MAVFKFRFGGVFSKMDSSPPEQLVTLPGIEDNGIGLSTMCHNLAMDNNHFSNWLYGIIYGSMPEETIPIYLDRSAVYLNLHTRLYGESYTGSNV